MRRLLCILEVMKRFKFKLKKTHRTNSVASSNNDDIVINWSFSIGLVGWLRWNCVEPTANFTFFPHKIKNRNRYLHSAFTICLLEYYSTKTTFQLSFMLFPFHLVYCILFDSSFFFLIFSSRRFFLFLRL